MNFSFGPIASLQYVGRVFESQNELNNDKNSAQTARHPRLQDPGVFGPLPSSPGRIQSFS